MCYPYTLCKCTNKSKCNPSTSDNVKYTGPTLSCLGVNTNDSLTSVLQKMNVIICNLLPSTTTTSTTTAPSTTSSSTTVVPTTTSTSTFPPSCNKFIYDVTGYNCGVCGTSSAAGDIENNVPLEIGKYYFFTQGNYIIRINSLVGCTNEGSLNNVNVASKQDTCAAVVCTGVNYFNFSGAKASNTLACAETVFPMVLYSSTPTIGMGSILYTNTGLTIPFNGNSLWYKLGATNTAWAINNLGVTIGNLSC